MAVVKFTAPSQQKYACRDCPARCCRVPWGIRFSEEESERYRDDPWIRQRVGAEGLTILSRGVLPMVEHERRLQCVFLDDDQLCSLHKRFGHEYIPRACQSFPFGFVARGKDRAYVQLSQLCPSIRDNYGEPIGDLLPDKLAQAGEVERVTTAMSTLTRVILSRTQYLLVAQSWITQLGEDGPVVEILARLYDQLHAFEAALPSDTERVKDGAVKTALHKARQGARAEPLERPRRPSFHTRALHSYLLGNLCYPSRVRQPHRIGRKPLLLALRSHRNKMAWLRGRGTVDLLFAPGPLRLTRVPQVQPFLAEPEGALVRDYLRAVLERQHVFTRPRYLGDVLVDLAFAAVIVARFARCMAAASDRQRVTAADVGEGISVSELVLLGHVALGEEGKTMQNLRVLMLSDRDKLRQLLASEV